MTTPPLSESIPMRQHALLLHLRDVSQTTGLHQQAWEIAEQQNWKYPNVTKLLRALHERELVEYAPKRTGDYHYVSRHKLSERGRQYLLIHK